MQPLSPESITTDEVDLVILRKRNIRLSVLRMDKIHPVISGNKWFKLKRYLGLAARSAKTQIVTFGGAYSNHLIATAAVGKLFDLKTIGIVRGEEPRSLSHTLIQARQWGMQLIFVSREDYRKKKLPESLTKTGYFIINEGGYGIDGAIGAAEMIEFCKKEIYSHVACAVGTSTMMAGLIKAAPGQQQVIGISVLKNNHSVTQDLCALLTDSEQKKLFDIHHEYHFGGYAKYDQQLLDFMNDFYQKTTIPTDFVYTAKTFYAIFDGIGNNRFPPGSNILLIHSGGLQGNLSLPRGALIF